MGGVRVLFVAAVLLWASPANAYAVSRWQPYIAEASLRYGIPQAWIKRVMRTESGGQTMLGGRPIRSRAGAMGLMQIMPATWVELRQAHGLGSNPDDPRDNILAGTAYLRAMYDRFGYPGLFAAYNAGPARYASYVRGRSRLPSETIAYLRAVTQRSFETLPKMRRNVLTEHQKAEPERLESLFYALKSATEIDPTPHPHVPNSSLFAIRRAGESDDR